jgi:hypothetical protein
MYKNKGIKKYISTILSLVLVLGSLSIGYLAFGDDAVAINEANFPDENWRKVVLATYDTNGDGSLSTAERNKTFMTISVALEDTCGENAKITNLKGIEYFTNLKRLYCGGIGLETLDVSKLTNLEQLTCQGNALTSLTLGTNSNLTWLNCASNDLKTLNVSGCTALERLECYANKLVSLNVSGATALQQLYCQQNELRNLNLLENSNLTDLYCAYNHLWELNLSYNSKLTDITEYKIGNQTVEATATTSRRQILIAHTFSVPANIVSTSLDVTTEVVDSDGETSTETTLGYNGTAFFTDDALKIKDNTITYQDSINNDGSVNMDVTVTIDRDFYQVKFFADEGKTTLVSSQFVNEGDEAYPPDMSDYATGKTFSCWSEDVTNVTKDMDVYVIWAEDHNFYVSKFDNGAMVLSCNDCDVTLNVEFMDVLDTEKTDYDYVSAVDVNGDGTINAKDYAYLLNQFK